MSEESEADKILAVTKQVPPPTDPWTVVGYMAIDYALSYLQNANPWQQAGSQIAQIAQQLLQIAAEVNQIVPKMEQALLRQTLTNFKTEIESHRGVLEEIAARYPGNFPTGNDLDEVRRRKMDVRTRVGQLIQHQEYGFAGYPGVLAGFSTMQLAHQLTQTSRAERNVLIVEKIMPYLNAALSPQVDWSLEAGRSKAQLAARTALNNFNALLGRRWLISYSQTPGGTFASQHFRIVVCSGTIDNPNLQISIEDHPLDSTPPTDPWLPGIHEHCDWGDRDKAVGYTRQALETMRSVAALRRREANLLEGRCIEVRKCIGRLNREL